jgi:hypothetical protein
MVLTPLTVPCLRATIGSCATVTLMFCSHMKHTRVGIRFMFLMNFSRLLSICFHSLEAAWTGALYTFMRHSSEALQQSSLL